MQIFWPLLSNVWVGKDLLILDPELVRLIHRRFCVSLRDAVETESDVTTVPGQAEAERILDVGLPPKKAPRIVALGQYNVGKIAQL
jgi:hypothetical protein